MLILFGIAVAVVLLLAFLIPDVETVSVDAEFREETPGSFIKLEKGHVWYELDGETDRPVVVFIHGFTIPSVIWQYTIPAVRRAGYTTLCFDNYGRGWSDRPDAEYNAALYIEQIRGLLSALGIREKVALVGHSQGGAIASAFTVAHPERVSKLVLIDPVGIGFPVTLPERILMLPLIGDYLARLFLDRAIESTFTTHFTDPEVRELIHPRYHRQRRLCGFRRSFMSGIRNETLGGMKPVYMQLGKLSVPKLLIWGEDDRLAPFPVHQRLLDLLPGTEFLPVPDAGHNAQIDGRVLVNPSLVRFLSTA